MQSAERRGDDVAWAAAARAGAALVPEIERDAGALLGPAERAVAERFLASLQVHDHGGM
jgi:hypothetical protein